MVPKILLYEPQAVIALDLKQILKKNFEVRRIAAVDDLALEIIKEKPDIFIICPDLSFLTPKELVSAINNQNIPVIILSAMREGILNEHFINNGIDFKFLSKPFDETELVNCICCLMDEKTISAYN